MLEHKQQDGVEAHHDSIPGFRFVRGLASLAKQGGIRAGKAPRNPTVLSLELQILVLCQRGFKQDQ